MALFIETKEAQLETAWSPWPGPLGWASKVSVSLVSDIMAPVVCAPRSAGRVWPWGWGKPLLLTSGGKHIVR